jgi:hypothetical protein
VLTRHIKICSHTSLFMTYHPYDSSNSDYSTETDRPISREEFNDLTDILKHLANESSPNIDLALQPTVMALNKLLTAQQSLQQEVVQQRETIKKQSNEIAQLKKQSSDSHNWLTTHFNQKTIGIFSLATAVLLAALLIGFQKLLPVKIDSEAVDKLDFLYFQELKRYEKAKTDPKK